MKILPILLLLCFALLIHLQAAQADHLIRQQCRTGNTPTELASGKTYAVRYERYGALGIYHVGLLVDVYRNGVHLQRFHIDGAGRLPKYELNLLFCKLRFRLPPAYLAGYVNPKGYKQHFLGLFTSSEFGPTYTLNDTQGSELITMAHRAMSVMNHSDKLLYCTIPFQIGPLNIKAFQIGSLRIGPIQIRPLQFWTSNSVVASLVRAANEQGIELPVPTGGYYPGFNGPYLSDSLFRFEPAATSRQTSGELLVVCGK